MGADAGLGAAGVTGAWLTAGAGAAGFGDAFGASGEGYARISYAYSVEHLETAMRRIRAFLKDHGWLAE